MSYPIEKYKFYAYVRKNKDGTTSSCVNAISSYAGKSVKGTAACQSSDEFDMKKGMELSAARCDFKVCEKRQARAAKKVAEAEAQLEAATRRLEKMKKYLADAIQYVTESSERLNKLESDLEYSK